MEPRKKFTLLEDVQDLDKTIIRLIAKRTELVQRMEQNRSKTAFVAAKIAASEKELRKNWEHEASTYSRDERFLRGVFALLQELELTPKEAKEKISNVFNLAPPPRPVNINLPQITSLRHSRFWVFLAAAAGKPLELSNQLFNDPMIELIKALNQVGAHLSWNDIAEILSAGGPELVMQDKTIYAGSSAMNFYLLSALAMGSPGVVKFTGDSALKLQDLSVWRKTTPLFGARLAHVIPKSNGLPVHLECSGIMPEEVVLPPDLPADAFCALLLASIFWPGKITFVASGQPWWQACVQEIMPLFEACGVDVTVNDADITIVPGFSNFPKQPALPMDPFLVSLCLSFPAFAGGVSVMRKSPEEVDNDKLEDFCEYDALLAWAGLKVEKTKKFLRSTGSIESVKNPGPLFVDKVPKIAWPLAFAFVANYAHKTKETIEITLSSGKPEEFPAFLQESNFVLALAQEFLLSLGVELTGEGPFFAKLLPAGAERPSSMCTAPHPSWAFGLALGAYLRPNLGLTNAAIISEVMPSFWALYNSLPSPSLFRHKPKEVVDEPKRRRKIVT